MAFDDNKPIPNKYSKPVTITPGMCDYSGRLGIFDTFSLFMDLAAEHADLIGIGQPYMVAHSLFWLTVKTRIRFHERPFMMGRMTASTWPVKPTSFRTDRCYRLEHDGVVVAEGCTEWAVMNLKENRLEKLNDLFPESFRFSDDAVRFEGFPRIDPSFDECTSLGEVTVTSSDVDLGHHMNNAAYIRAILGKHTTSQLEGMKIQEMSVIFKASAHEGDVLTLKERAGVPSEGIGGRTIETALLFPDGKPAVLAQIVCGWSELRSTNIE